MKMTTVKATEWTYPDRFEYRSGADRADIFGARSSYAEIQLVFSGVPEGASISAKASGAIAAFDVEWYELVPVFVEANANLPENDESRDEWIPSRAAPYWLYDCVKPLGAHLTPKDGGAALYAALKIPQDAVPGVYEGTYDITVAGETFAVPVMLTVYAARIPEAEHLKIINGYSRAAVQKFHNTEIGTPAFHALDEKYLRLLRRMRQNMLYVGGVRQTGPDESGHYQFDFSALKQDVEFFRSLGYKYFNMSSVGGRRSWAESTILVAGHPSMSYEAYCYLADYLPALQAFLDEQGWTDCFYMGVSDEPNDANATEFRALCGLIRKLAPRIRLIDALSYTAVHGALDVWVPLNASYEEHRAEFESFRHGDDEIWHYVCCGPRDKKYINRFMDYPLLSTEYLFWGNYKYNLAGYLHWASNCYQPGQNPFLQNCPEHHNADAVCILPPGDTHILYPGDGEPWMSMQLEAQRRSAEEYELLRMLAEHDKARADEICAKGFRSFRDVEYDPNRFEAIRRELLAACSALTANA